MNMKFATVLVALTAALSASHVSASESVKVGYVNTQRIFRDAPAAVKAAKKIETEFSRRDQDLQRMAKQLQGMQETLEKNAVTMTETDRRTKERELNELSREFQRKQRELSELAVKTYEESGKLTGGTLNEKVIAYETDIADHVIDE